MIDTTFLSLLPHIKNPSSPTLWLADENALEALHSLDNSGHTYLHIATNRYDIYQLAGDKNISVEFNDFTLEELPFTPENIVYRISKEKSLTHYLFNKAAQLLGDKGTLIIAGKKQEGIKTYANNLSKTFLCNGKLKKNNSDYHGYFNHFNTTNTLDDQTYTLLQQPFLKQEPSHPQFSKPGVFGWNKIDIGTELLLKSLPNILEKHYNSPGTILDLGCGYGWIFSNLPYYLNKETLKNTHITATDNNAAAIRCAEKNAMASNIPTNIIADDCAKNITEKFDLILCNPPFHQGFAHDKSLTCKFLQETKSHLSHKGIAVFVVNEFISLPKEQLMHFNGQEIITKEHGFKIILLY